MPTKDIFAVHRKPMKQDIFEFVHERIIAGQYAPGEWLRQDVISSELGVSMTPVREALDLLVSAGLAERVPYRGVRVLQPSAEEIVDSYGMRLLLESAAIYAAAINISPEPLIKLGMLLDESKSLVGKKDMSRSRVLNRELHTAIVSSSGNALLYQKSAVKPLASPSRCSFGIAMGIHRTCGGCRCKAQSQGNRNRIFYPLIYANLLEFSENIGADLQRLADLSSK